jgi:hypothetical protein
MVASHQHCLRPDSWLLVVDSRYKADVRKTMSEKLLDKHMANADDIVEAVSCGLENKSACS